MRRARAIAATGAILFCCAALADAPATAQGGTAVPPGGLQPFEYYRVILDRKPFGELAPPKPETEKAPVEDQAAIEEKKKEDQLAKQIDMVAVNRTPRGKIAVGFIDKNAKPPRNYYLNVGDSSGGFTVLEADFDEETAMIEKDGVSIALKLGKGVIPKPEKDGEGDGESAPEATAGDTAGITPGMRPSPATRPSGFVRPFRPSGPPAARGQPGLSYAERVRERREQERSEAAAHARAERQKIDAEVAKRVEETKANAAKREREINLDLIRRGEAPISDIELTKEEDAALVEAGALPQQ